jgi:hypothetical protein
MEMWIDECTWFLVTFSLSILGVCLDAFAQLAKIAPLRWHLYFARTLNLQIASDLDAHIKPSRSATLIARVLAMLVAVIHVFIGNKRLEALLSLILFLWYPAVCFIQAKSVCLRHH